MAEASESSRLSRSQSTAANIESLNEIETCAKNLDAEATLLLETLQSGLHRISSSTVNSVSQYSSLVSSTCDELDASIKSMYVMMARCEELVKVMSKVPKLQESLVAIKKMLAHFESSLSH